MPQNNFKGVSHRFRTVFKKLKKWPKMSKKLRLTPYHFGRFWPLFQLLKNGTKRPKKHLKMPQNNFKGVSHRFRTVFKKLKKWPKMSKKLRLTPYHFGQETFGQ